MKIKLTALGEQLSKEGRLKDILSFKGELSFSILQIDGDRVLAAPVIIE